MKIRQLMVLALSCLCQPGWAGLMASGTRVIYQEGTPGQTLMLANTNVWPVIVQSWVDNGEGDPQNTTAPFVIVPAVFRLDASARQGIRIIYNQSPLPKDRESVFWLNLYEIPPQSVTQPTSPRLALTMNTQMKVFYRPAGLPASPDALLGKLTFRLINDDRQWFLECRNPTPFHISFTALSLERSGHTWEAESQVDMMASPYATHRFRLQGQTPPDATSTVHYRYIDDYGSVNSRDARLSAD
ncbi:fimbrial biogenesis chaperone [[Enterobacter] lignolyticus]|uniref:Pili assembly chaperone, N-terminal protein n=1 Tax=Enterobacter lignolyticus (strain SCF1) TaxID=701347 RepID=E3GA56_ENTLS|nr:molecular chaperone [[Enterobacter] lignolyticus]ADO46503.1 Pili assembly chaperone, N-terminal protein [[Enterobacter] lignolyticus SCF1]